MNKAAFFDKDWTSVSWTKADSDTHRNQCQCLNVSVTLQQDIGHPWATLR
jgi:hypothetical protein